MADAIEKTPIPDTPPAKSGAKKEAMSGIAAIKSACESAGITSKYAICSFLAIAGTESKWDYSSEEAYNYSEKTLLSGMFSGVTADEAQKYGNPVKKGMSRLEFFGWLYGTNKGLSPAEGNYYGRGYIQLTFQSAYKKIGAAIGADLVNNPSLVTQSPEFGARVLVEFFKWKIPTLQSDQWKPGFFQQALRAVGGAKSGWEEKTRYYEYFLGGKAADAPTDKDASVTTANKTEAEIAAAPPHKREAYKEDRSSNFDKIGFTDPEGKYPLRDYMNEADTNRLARGIIDGTHVKFKDSARKTNIPVANTSGTYDQPLSSYNTVYPYNKVFETESGHVVEFDDSPDGERINVFHRKGTFVEIDPNGTQVNYIVGDSFHIVERNGNIFINGTANLTVSGPMNILVHGDTNLEVSGQVDAVFHNNVNMGVAKDLNVAVGGDYNILVEGNYNVEVGKTSNHRTIGTMSMETTDALKLKTSGSMSLEGGDSETAAEILMKLSSDIKIETSGDYQIKSKNFTIDALDTVTINGATKIDLNPEGFVHLESLGTSKTPVDFAGNEIDGRGKENILVDTVLTPSGDYNPNTLNEKTIESVLNGNPLSADILSQFGGSTPNVYDVKYNGPVERKTNLSAAGSSNIHRLVVPQVDSAHQAGSENLKPPARHTDPVYKYETEEDWLSPQGQRARNSMIGTSDYEHNGGVPGTPQESYSASGGVSKTTKIPESKLNEISNSTDFPANFKLSDNFTLGMLVHQQGHTLKDTTLPDGQYTKQKLVANLAALATNILEPIYKELGACKQQGGGIWQITSGLRNETSGSDHNKGCAVDIQLTTRDINEQYELCKKLEKLLPYHKILFEYRNKGTSNWIHISFVSDGRMGLCSTMIDDKIVDSSGKVTHGSTGIHKFYV